MVGDRIHMLLVEDDKFDRLAFERHVRKMDLPYDFQCASSSAQARVLLEKESFDVVLLDYLLGDGIGTELLPLLGETPGIIITGVGSEEVAASAMRHGAYDYVVKDAECKFLTSLPLTIGTVLERRKAEEARNTTRRRYRALSEYADAVIHNVANLLNSINTSCHQIKSSLVNSRISRLERVNQLIEENADDLFLTAHPKGKHLPDYLKNLTVRLEKERKTLLTEIDAVLKNLVLMSDIIQTQQSQEMGTEPLARFQLRHVIEDALRVGLTVEQRESVTIVIDVSPEISLKSHKSMVTHILVNLVRNAFEAMADRPGERVLTLASGHDTAHGLLLSLTDTGHGLADGDLQRIFEHGYTTKSAGHGFGLHYSALAMEAIGGHIALTSPGPGLGATVTLTFPPFAG